MQSFMYTIKNPVGMHARHAGLIVKTAKEFESAVTVWLGDKSADGKRILGLMGLGVRQDSLIRVTVEGPDEDEAARALKNMFWTSL